MKKKLLAGLLALVLLLGGVTVGRAGNGTDFLVSLSYLTGTYLSELKTAVAQWVSQGTQAVYDSAAGKAGQQGPPEGGHTSAGFSAGAGTRGDAVLLPLGAVLIWTSGSGYVTSGVLVDATAGAELALGAALVPGHRYLAAEAAQVVAASQAQWLAEGRWQLGTGEVPLDFTDVPMGQWYYEDVRFVVENGLFQGVGGGRFSPGGTMERAMLTTVLHRLAGEPAVAWSPAFTDVAEGLWYTPGVLWCAQMQVVNGVGGGRFNPAGKVTREQIAVMLYQYAVRTGHAAPERGDLSGFADGGSVSSWARDAVAWAVGAGLLNGSGGRLLPGDSATRAQVAAMLHRFSNWLDAR